MIRKFGPISQFGDFRGIIGLKFPTGGRQGSSMFTNIARVEPESTEKQLLLSDQSGTFTRDLQVSSPTP